MFKKNLLPAFRESCALKITGIIILLSITGLLISFLFIFHQNHIKHYFILDSGKTYEEADCSVRMEIPFRSDGQKNFWQQPDGSFGAQYDIYVHNFTSQPFSNYVLTMKVPEDSRIDSSWNGIFSHEKGEISMIPIESAKNLVINPKQNVKFGFVLYSPELLESSEFRLEGFFIQNFLKNPVFDIFLGIFAADFIIILALLYTYGQVKKEHDANFEKIDSLVNLCARFIDVRDPYTRMHSRHVAEISKKLALELGFSERDAENVYYDGMLHDIGKVLIPKEILCKGTGLDKEEWDEMKKHTIYGSNILEGFDGIPEVRESALYHHERFDGSGYLNGLQGKDIPLVSRIICVADSYDAMSTDRAYRKHLSQEEILKELENNSGTQFDPEIAQAAIKLIREGKLKVQS